MTDKPQGVRHRAADTTRAEELLGWEPEYTVEEGIQNTLDWYLDNRDKGYVGKISKRCFTGDNQATRIF
jgi:UDP-glucose 4-epimerase